MNRNVLSSPFSVTGSFPATGNRKLAALKSLRALGLLSLLSLPATHPAHGAPPKDPRPSRIAEDGTQVIDYIAELEDHNSTLTDQVRNLENELRETRAMIGAKGPAAAFGGADAIRERDLAGRRQDGGRLELLPGEEDQNELVRANETLARSLRACEKTLDTARAAQDDMKERLEATRRETVALKGSAVSAGACTASLAETRSDLADAQKERTALLTKLAAHEQSSKAEIQKIREQSHSGAAERQTLIAAEKRRSEELKAARAELARAAAAHEKELGAERAKVETLSAQLVKARAEITSLESTVRAAGTFSRPAASSQEVAVEPVRAAANRPTHEVEQPRAALAPRAIAQAAHEASEPLEARTAPTPNLVGVLRAETRDLETRAKVRDSALAAYSRLGKKSVQLRADALRTSRGQTIAMVVNRARAADTLEKAMTALRDVREMRAKVEEDIRLTYRLAR